MRYDLACGSTKQPGYTGVDVAPLEGVDVVADLDVYPWPIPTSSAQEVFCSHYVEHTANLIGFMDELYRIMQPGGLVYIIHPYQHSNRAWQDPTHVRALNEDSWFYYDKQWRHSMQLGHYPIRCDFEVLGIQYAVSEEFRHMADSPKLREFARTRNNVVDDLHVRLQARKEA